jgi:hypothetical protein
MGSSYSDTTLWITKRRDNKIRNNTVDGLLEDLLIDFLSCSFSYFKVCLIVLKLIEDIFTASKPVGGNWMQVLIKAFVFNFVGHHMIMIN